MVKKGSFSLFRSENGAAEKLYRPSKMWGSYLGAVLILLLPIFVIPGFFGPGGIDPFFLLKGFEFFGLLGLGFIVMGMVIGFFLGYWVHISFKKSLRKGFLIGLVSLIIAQLFFYFLGAFSLALFSGF